MYQHMQRKGQWKVTMTTTDVTQYLQYKRHIELFFVEHLETSEQERTEFLLLHARIVLDKATAEANMDNTYAAY